MAPGSSIVQFGLLAPVTVLLDALVEDDWVVQMPPVGAGVATHDSPLVEIGHAKAGRAALLQSPGAEEIILCADAPNGGIGLTSDINLLIPNAEQGRAAGADR